AHQQTRRRFFQTAVTAGAAVSPGDFSPPWPLAPAHPDEGQGTPHPGRFRPEKEPGVRLLEPVADEKVGPVQGVRRQKERPDRPFIAALSLAAIRAARWHGDGIHGYDHSAYWVHSAYQLSLDLPAGEQLLPAFQALLGFKGGQKAYPGKKGTPALTGKL